MKAIEELEAARCSDICGEIECVRIDRWMTERAIRRLSFEIGVLKQELRNRKAGKT